jgi:ribosomal protein L21E
MKERKTLGRLAKAKIKGEKVIIKIDTGAYTGAIDKNYQKKSA